MTYTLKLSFYHRKLALLFKGVLHRVLHCCDTKCTTLQT